MSLSPQIVRLLQFQPHEQVSANLQDDKEAEFDQSQEVEDMTPSLKVSS